MHIMVLTHIVVSLINTLSSISGGFIQGALRAISPPVEELVKENPKEM